MERLENLSESKSSPELIEKLYKHSIKKSYKSGDGILNENAHWKCCNRWNYFRLADQKIQYQNDLCEPNTIAPKKSNKGKVYGELIFGLSWTITSACPVPLFAQIGAGATVIIVTLLSAIVGTWVYRYLREKLPH